MTILFIFLLFLRFVFGENVLKECYDNKECITRFQRKYTSCLGRFCGRRILSTDSNISTIESFCHSCIVATYSDGWVCVPCTNTINYYSFFFLFWVWFYLGLNGILNVRSEYKKWPYWIRLFYYMIAFSETASSAFIAYFMGGMGWKVCPINSFSDFYPVFFNPPGRDCTSERMYPFYRIPFFFYLIHIVILIPRFLLTLICCRRRVNAYNPIIYQLYNIPFFGVLYFFFAGLLYFSYPYVAIFLHGTAVLGMLCENDRNLMEISLLLVARWLIISLCLYAIFQFFIPHAWYLVFAAFAIASVVPLFVVIMKCLNFRKRFQKWVEIRFTRRGRRGKEGEEDENEEQEEKEDEGEGEVEVTGIASRRRGRRRRRRRGRRRIVGEEEENEQGNEGRMNEKEKEEEEKEGEEIIVAGNLEGEKVAFSLEEEDGEQ